MPRIWKLSLLCIVLLTISIVSLAQQIEEVPSIEIISTAQTLMGLGEATSESTVSAQRLAAMPLARPDDVLEMVPGWIVNHYALAGKANPYFWREFNLDHGTDFATYRGPNARHNDLLELSGFVTGVKCQHPE